MRERFDGEISGRGREFTKHSGRFKVYASGVRAGEERVVDDDDECECEREREIVLVSERSKNRSYVDVHAVLVPIEIHTL